MRLLTWGWRAGSRAEALTWEEVQVVAVKWQKEKNKTQIQVQIWKKKNLLKRKKAAGESSDVQFANAVHPTTRWGASESSWLMYIFIIFAVIIIFLWIIMIRVLTLRKAVGWEKGGEAKIPPTCCRAPTCRWRWWCCWWRGQCRWRLKTMIPRFDPLVRGFRGEI